jgi:3',5'-nucleoside bisphosphate phosphatase
VAVLAHPVLVKSKNAWLNETWMSKLVDMGLQGIEVYHYRLDEAARRYFLKMARRFSLAVTGGSDEHGWPAGFPRLGTQPVDEGLLTRLKSKIGDRR